MGLTSPIEKLLVFFVPSGQNIYRMNETINQPKSRTGRYRFIFRDDIFLTCPPMAEKMSSLPLVTKFIQTLTPKNSSAREIPP